MQHAKPNAQEYAQSDRSRRQCNTAVHPPLMGTDIALNSVSNGIPRDQKPQYG